jgi:hypothetical protein
MIILCNTRREIQTQTKLDQPFEKMDDTRLPKHALNYKPGSWTPQGKMATRRCRNRSNDLIHGGRLLLLLLFYNVTNCFGMYLMYVRLSFHYSLA